MGYMRGITAPLLTTYRTDGRLDLPAYQRLLSYAASGGLKGVFVGGTTGEFANLTIDERIEQLQAAMEVAPEGLEVMFNVTALNLTDVEKMIKAALSLNVRVLSLTSPYYHIYRPAMLTEYFDWIVKLAPTASFYLYNMPGMTKNPITNDVLMAILQTNSNVDGLKDSSMDFMTFLDYQRCTEDRDFELLTGNDAQVLTCLQAGGAGGLIAMAGVYPKIAQTIWDAYHDGDMKTALQAQNQIADLRGIARAAMPILAHKAMLQIQGIQTGPARLPFVPLSSDEVKRIEAQVKKVLG